jgi:cytochrome c-type biogenesis protein CcmE
MARRKLKFLSGILVVAAAIGVLVGVSFQGNMAYYIEVNDYISKGSAAYGDAFKVRGFVVAESIQRDPGTLGVEFEMNDGEGGPGMTVRYAKEVPDTFVDDAEVVVKGALTPDGVFDADTLLAKCPSKYEPVIEETGGQTS